MKRMKAVEMISEYLGDALLVSCNGFVSRELFTARDRPENFYMIGSMGLASAIGLGAALAQPDKRVVVVDGDGNILMNTGTLGSIASLAPKNLFHILLDNEAYDSTGGQSTIAGQVDLDKVAEAFGYATVVRIEDEQALAEALPTFFDAEGPAFLHVKVEKGTDHSISRVTWTPTQMTERFRGRATS